MKRWNIALGQIILRVAESGSFGSYERGTDVKPHQQAADNCEQSCEACPSLMAAMFSLAGFLRND
ncbi:hypothetical protein C0Q70_19188 [Pomacea canaliculata]|uniref:Uncharacterized protein n=1 Tax=Pomacea canaliculata TaxID=400727 RepID=A0A2T7NIN9_POMCA|nr:hypothetical protein C0Q70_19188 [Pomacea canaliculata]